MTDQGEVNESISADDTQFESEASSANAADELEAVDVGEDVEALAAQANTTDQGDPTDPWNGMEVRPRPDKRADSSDEALSADDANADADLPRLSRQEKQRARQRIRFSTAIPALVLIVGGVLALVRPVLRDGVLAAGWIAVALVLSLVLRFLFQGRRERGLFFVTALIILVLGFVALTITGFIDLSEGWPVIIILPGLAMLLTFMFERSHDSSLILPALMFIVAGGVILPFTMGFLDSSVLPGIALYWPVLLLLAALAVLPRAIRDRTE